MLDSNILVIELKPQLYYYILFWTNTFVKDMNPFILPAMVLIVPLLFFYGYLKIFSLPFGLAIIRTFTPLSPI